MYINEQKMHNSEQKMRYLEKCNYEESTIELIGSIFNSIQMTEDYFNKDASNFSQLEVIDMLKNFNSKSKKRLKSVCVFLSSYYNWCYDEGMVDNLANPFDSRITDIIIDGLITKEDLEGKFFNREQMLGYKDLILNVSNQFIVYGLYIGIKSEELIRLKIEDLDENTASVKLESGRVVIVDDLFIKLMKQTNNSEIYFADGVVKENKFNRYSYSPSKYVLKQCGDNEEGKPISVGALSVRMRTIKAQTGNEFFTAPNIYKNGAINYIKSRYEEQGITLKTAFTSQINGKLYTYEAQTQQYIDEFGANYTVRMLRKDIEGFIDVF